MNTQPIVYNLSLVRDHGNAHAKCVSFSLDRKPKLIGGGMILKKLMLN
jgi:hypothetical protein